MHAPQRRNNYASLTIEEAISRLSTTVETIGLRRSIKSHEKLKVEDAFQLINQPPQPASSKADERREHYRRFLKRIIEDCGPETVIVCAIGLGQTAVGTMKEYHRLRLPLEIKGQKDSFKTDVLRELAREYGGHDTPAAVPAEVPGHLGGYMGNRAGGTQATALGPTPNAPAIASQQPHIPQFQTSENHPNVGQDASQEEERGEKCQQASHTSNQLTNSALVPARVFVLTHEDAREIVASDQISGEVWMTDPFDNAATPFITVPISDETALWLSEAPHSSVS